MRKNERHRPTPISDERDGRGEVKLYPYQKPIVEYLKINYSAACWVEMRLGKTVCTVEALKDTPGTILVVCPKSVIPVWKEKASKNWTITNYEQLKKIEYTPHVLVIDESVRIKNPQAQITKLLFQKFLNVPRKILLSGNPAPNTSLEYFPQMAFLNGGEWMGCKNYWQFRQRYFTPDYMGFQWFPKAGTKEKIKAALDKDAFILTRKQAGMVSRKVYEKRYVEMPPKLKKVYQQMEKEFMAKLPDGKELEVDSVLPQLVYLQQLAGGFISNQEISDFKVSEVKELLEGELKGEPVVIWTNYRWEQKMLYSKIPGFMLINGDTPLEVRKEITTDFNRKGGVLIISSSCGKYGLDLSQASTALYFSNSYSLDDRSQSEERIFNVNKNELLLYIDTVTKDTIQEDILKVLGRKDKHVKYFMGDILQETRKRWTL